jgi:NADPH-dependent 2,4-dienoyl-CoA reductase/sulfur reductase-like enzyme
MTVPKQLVVVGGGPAGLSAATRAAQLGMTVTVVDEYDRIGGQYFRGRQDSKAAGSPRRFSRESPGVQVVANTVVVDTPAEGVLSVWKQGDGVQSLTYDALVLATGAYDRTVALPGWTLPGVLTAGGASTLAKAHGVTPGQRILVAGSGPFILAVADDLSAKGCDVQIVEATPLSTSMGGLPTIARDAAITRQTIGYLWRLGLRRVRRRYASMATAIHGDQRVEAATIHRVDQDWRPIAGSEKTIEVDAVCLGFGFVPQLELAQALQCTIGYWEETSDFYVKTDEAMRTSQANVYAAGEVTGIGGVQVAVWEGCLAGLAAAYDMGSVEKRDYDVEVRQLTRRLVRARRLGDWIRHAYRPRAGLWSLANAETMLCRCEDVTTQMAEEALAHNPATPYAVKTATRAGFGLCQGRICSPYMIEWLRAQHGYRVPEEERPWRVRPPIRPVPVGEWLMDETINDAMI